MNKRPLARYPALRLRRPRMSDWSRRLYAETQISSDDFLWAIILKDGKNVREPIDAMPGVFRLSPDEAVKAAAEAKSLGIPALALFPYTDADGRTPNGEEAFNPDNLMCRTAKAIKDAVPEIGLMADVALDPYTDHGHDGLMRDGEILNDETIDILVRQSIVQARAGYDIIAPSDMMDGRIGAIRAGLDSEGFQNVQIMAYAAKYASAFYGPYREAIGSAGVLKGDKRTYQMNPANADEALREVALDLAEGADSVMVKPGLAYLDIIRMARDRFDVPVFAYQVSGEYALVEAGVAAGVGEREPLVMEKLMAFKRAGCAGILTYYAPFAARILNG